MDNTEQVKDPKQAQKGSIDHSETIFEPGRIQSFMNLNDPKQAQNRSIVDSETIFGVDKKLRKAETLKKLLTSATNPKLEQDSKPPTLHNITLQELENGLEEEVKLPLIDFSSMDPTYKAICYKEFHSKELRFRKMLEVRDRRFETILACKDKKIDELGSENQKLAQKIEAVRSKLF